MFQKLEIFQMAQAMSQHAGKLQAVAAQNMANADTPGFKAKQLTPFKDTLAKAEKGAVQRATRSGHLNGIAQDGPMRGQAQVFVDEQAMSDPNGNSVAIEDQILLSVEAKRQHDRALAIYRSSLNILRTSIGRS